MVGQITKVDCKVKGFELNFNSFIVNRYFIMMNFRSLFCYQFNRQESAQIFT